MASYEEETEELSVTERLTELFEKHNGELIKFERIPEAERRHPRKDLCAFLYLHEKLGFIGENKTQDILASAGHDKVYLAYGVEECGALTEEDVIYIQRCGVMLGEYGLEMFV